MSFWENRKAGVKNLLVKGFSKKAEGRSHTDDNEWVQHYRSTYTVDKTLSLCQENILETEEADVLVCSAFRGSYEPYEGTLIHGLKEMGISVKELAGQTEKACDVYDENGVRRCWISRELPSHRFKRIACIEILDPGAKSKSYETGLELLTNVSNYLWDLFQQIQKNGIPMKRVVMTAPGSGNQNIEMFYVASVLIPTCRKLLTSIREMEQICIFEKDKKKMADLNNVFQTTSKMTDKEKQVFISYSSKDAEIAEQIYDFMREKGIRCWKAPDSIPKGSNYQQEIPKGLQQTYISLLILSENMEESRWCYKEIGTAIGSGHIVIPCKIRDYASSDQFNFLMDGEQIFPGYEYLQRGGMDEMLGQLTRIIERYIWKQSMKGEAASI